MLSTWKTELSVESAWELQHVNFQIVKNGLGKNTNENKGGILSRKRFRGFWLRIEELRLLWGQG